MNQFGFAHLPFAMANRRNPFQSLAQPGQPAPMGQSMGPNSGVNAFLGADPQTQSTAQQIQANPFMSMAGTTVPQNTWTGNQFNIPAMPQPTITTPGPPPAAPPPAASMTGPNAPLWTQGMFTPIGARTEPGGPRFYAPPKGVPVPHGYEWDGRLGYFRPERWSNEQDTD